jgi:hypothetical protein
MNVSGRWVFLLWFSAPLSMRANLPIWSVHRVIADTARDVYTGTITRARRIPRAMIEMGYVYPALRCFATFADVAHECPEAG